MSSVAIRPWTSIRLSSAITPAAPTASHGLPPGGSDEHVHRDDRDQPEDNAADAPAPRVVAEQLDAPCHDELRQLRMLRVRILAQGRVRVGLPGRRADPGDDARRVDVVGLVEDQCVVRSCATRRAARPADEQNAGEQRQQQDDEQRDERRARMREQLPDPSHHATHALHVRNVLVDASVSREAPRVVAGGCRARTQKSWRSGATRDSEDTARRRQGPLE